MGRLKQAVMLAIAGFLALAWLDPDVMSGLSARAGDGVGWQILAILAYGASASVDLPLPLFGPDASIRIPAFLGMALPYFLRFMAWRALRLGLGALFSGPRRRELVSQWAPAARYDADESSGIPANAEAAIEAALRARAQTRG